MKNNLQIQYNVNTYNILPRNRKLLFLLEQCIVKVLCFHFKYPLQQFLPLSFFFSGGSIGLLPFAILFPQLLCTQDSQSNHTFESKTCLVEAHCCVSSERLIFPTQAELLCCQLPEREAGIPEALRAIISLDDTAIYYFCVLPLISSLLLSHNNV